MDKKMNEAKSNDKANLFITIISWAAFLFIGAIAIENIFNGEKTTGIIFLIASILFIPLIRLNIILKVIIAIILGMMAISNLSDVGKDELNQHIIEDEKEKKVEEENERNKPENIAKRREETEKAKKEESKKLKSMVMYGAKKSVREVLKDAESAKFKDINYSTKIMPMACGKVNSKNSFGAYAGYKYFISGGTRETTYLEEQVKDFDVLWNKFCVGK